MSLMSQESECLTIESIVPKLQKAKGCGGGWSALCPSHEDKNRSLFVKVMPSGFILLKCFAGCTRNEILAALGLASCRPRPFVRVAAKRAACDFTGILQRCIADTTSERLAELASELGLSIKPLVDIGARFDARFGSWLFPMFDAGWRVIGIRTRLADGSKRAIPGSTGGLFLPKRIGEVGPFFIVEGPTELAALLDIGFTGLGRANCNSCEQLTLDLLRKQPRRDVIILANRDRPKLKSTGETFLPGQHGARKLAGQIHEHSVKIILPPRHKDLRGWLNAEGAAETRRSLEYVIRSTNWEPPVE